MPDKKRLSEKMTVAEIKKYIKNATAEVNAKYAEYKTAVLLGVEKENELVDDFFNRLKLNAGVTTAGKLKTNFLLKRKSELLVQARQLQSFEQWDIYTPPAKTAAREKAERSYKTFKKNWGVDLTYDEWSELWEIFGVLKDNLLNFVYEDDASKTAVLTAVSDAVKSGALGATDIVKIMQRVGGKTRGKTAPIATDGKALARQLRSELEAAIRIKQLKNKK